MNRRHTLNRRREDGTGYTPKEWSDTRPALKAAYLAGNGAGAEAFGADGENF